MLPPMRARSAMPTNARLRSGANALSVANAMPIEPKLANPIERIPAISQKRNNRRLTTQCIGQDDLGAILEQRKRQTVSNSPMQSVNTIYIPQHRGAVRQCQCSIQIQRKGVIADQLIPKCTNFAKFLIGNELSQ